MGPYRLIPVASFRRPFLAQNPMRSRLHTTWMVTGFRIPKRKHLSVNTVHTSISTVMKVITRYRFRIGASSGEFLWPNNIQYSDVYSLQDAVHVNPDGVLFLPSNIIVAGRQSGAPVYVDAQLFPASYQINGKNNLVWLHYYLLFGEDRKYDSFDNNHRGDWEHICVVVQRSSAGNKSALPVRMHWHHHANADIDASAYAYHSDSWGYKHPRVYIEAGGHGMYRNPGDGLVGPHLDNSGTDDNPLDNPFVFMRRHWSNRSGAPDAERDIIETFIGRWDQGGDGGITGPAVSPRGPLVFNDRCDHDYVEFPGTGAFLTGSNDCSGI